ncbi:NAD(+) kinase [Toensbergia leucococca]|nr:NAD(+) kinase [Toensbergia leucococca]
MAADLRRPLSIGDNLLRDYTLHLDPLSTNSNMDSEEDVKDHMNSFSTASTQVNNSPQDLTMSLPSSPLYNLRGPKSFVKHRKPSLSLESTTHKSALKSLTTRVQKNGNSTMAIRTSLSGLTSAPSDNETQNLSGTISTKRLSSALSGLNGNFLRAPASARFTSLQSPCFFHQRFDDAVNVDRVLEEIAAEDDGISHCRLMQTATSVREISKQLQRRPIKQAVRTVMIITKARDNQLVFLTRELAEWLLKTPRYNSDLGVTVYVDAKLSSSKRFDAASLLASNPRYKQMLRYWTPDLCWTSPEQFDLVLTLGGDGTVLYTSWLFQRIVPPILSFALGSLGFLTNFQFASYKTHLDRIMGEQGMRVNLRMRFTCTIFRASTTTPKSIIDPEDPIESEQFEVLNELVIDRGPSPYVSNLEIYGDSQLLTVVQADGCIFSTPTGSTAYSLSAGGPLTHPSIPGILLTPICPHTLSFRPMVLSDSLLLKVCVPRTSRSTAYASFDGKGRVELRRGDCVQVEAGKYPFPTVVGEGGTGGEWFESVRRALRWNNRGAVQKGFGSVARGWDGNAEGDEEIEETEREVLDEEWDIDADPIEVGVLDSGFGASEESGSSAG